MMLAATNSETVFNPLLPDGHPLLELRSMHLSRSQFISGTHGILLLYARDKGYLPKFFTHDQGLAALGQGYRDMYERCPEHRIFALAHEMGRPGFLASSASDHWTPEEKLESATRMFLAAGHVALAEKAGDDAQIWLLSQARSAMKICAEYFSTVQNLPQDVQRDLKYVIDDAVEQIKLITDDQMSAGIVRVSEAPDTMQ
ncbi:MAG: hypothetical protein RE468_11940 [Acidithiobacillus caldus]|uniref:hypothetical protein n=1 Tax=Acidithiobacillus caldus TaxID=33059 RepID=UPI0028156705|nr:hypothetical protein [Acidithiobacillus caldus]WMT46589.1 MAG: hypothetical protein RE468_11940 [Acidithiobacillus caldus]